MLLSLITFPFYAKTGDGYPSPVYVKDYVPSFFIYNVPLLLLASITSSWLSPFSYIFSFSIMLKCSFKYRKMLFLEKTTFLKLLYEIKKGDA